MGRVLVACQVGLSVVLLVGAGLFVQTLRNLSRQDVGFNPDRLLQVSIDTRFAGYGKGQVGDVYRLLLERVAAVPGVESVTGVRNPILRHSLSKMAVRLPGVEFGQGEMWDGADVGPAFFETMAIPVLRGRTFTAADFAGDQRWPVRRQRIVGQALLPERRPCRQADRHHRRGQGREDRWCAHRGPPDDVRDGDEGTGSRELAPGQNRERA